MQLLLPPSIFILIILLTTVSGKVSTAIDCRHGNGASKVAYTITVNKSGKPGPGIFNTVQAAIDSIPPNNDQWVKVVIFSGIYKEKVSIPEEKQCIFLEGEGRHLTTITYDGHGQTDESATFTSSPDNVVVKGITFENSYNLEAAPNLYKGQMAAGDVKRALAARIYGDKSSFNECGFMGFQDTLWDVSGRHYFKNCYIEGGVDFIWGNGQSIYEDCMINVTIGTFLPQGYMGYITAQGRESSDEPTGFMFRRGRVFGSGQTLLGRAYGPYSRVIFQHTILDGVVAPQGWFAWNYQGKEDQFTYAEVDCGGPGSNTTERVKWMKKLRPEELNQFSTSSFINQDRWLNRLPLW
ncbi:putative pectinesterase 52 [Corylus avellana]|uniref:putative pectinesterase 52 n=1 Tax=Corylus avellana TaxID=13451 RepID=UPI001E21BAC4|nr:putative pectinesterase 52 [Corylus avellana]